MPLKTAIYARVSTAEQSTIEMQVEQCREYAKARGWKIVSELSEVKSGAKTRPKREELIKFCRKRQIDIVLVWKLDRWGRSLPDIVSSLNELECLGVRFVSLTEALDFTTPIGRAMGGLLAVFADFERELISERVKAGVAKARAKGKHIGRPRTIEEYSDEVKKLWKEHKNRSLISRKLGISRRSVSRILSSI